jgi:hypothetical protein
MAGDSTAVVAPHATAPVNAQATVKLSVVLIGSDLAVGQQDLVDEVDQPAAKANVVSVSPWLHLGSPQNLIIDQRRQCWLLAGSTAST